MEQIETINSLRSQLTSKSSKFEAVLRLPRKILLTLPTDFDDDFTPDDTLNHFLCQMLTQRLLPDGCVFCRKVSTQTILRRQMTLWCRQPAAWWLSSLILIRRTLITPAIRQTNQCGLEGLRGLLRNIPCEPHSTLSPPNAFTPIKAPWVSPIDHVSNYNT